MIFQFYLLCLFLLIKRNDNINVHTYLKRKKPCPMIMEPDDGKVY